MEIFNTCEPLFLVWSVRKLITNAAAAAASSATQRVVGDNCPAQLNAATWAGREARFRVGDEEIAIVSVQRILTTDQFSTPYSHQSAGKIPFD